MFGETFIVLDEESLKMQAALMAHKADKYADKYGDKTVFNKDLRNLVRGNSKLLKKAREEKGLSKNDRLFVEPTKEKPEGRNIPKVKPKQEYEAEKRARINQNRNGKFQQTMNKYRASKTEASYLI